MRRSTYYSFVFALSLSLSACSGCTDDNNGSNSTPDAGTSNPDGRSSADGSSDGDAAANSCDPLTGCVDASEWVQRATEIERFCYRSQPATPDATIEVYDESEKLGQLDITQVDGSGESSQTGAMVAEFQSESGPSVMLESTGEVVNEGYKVDMKLERSSETAHIVARYKPSHCYEQSPPISLEGPPCTWPIKLGEIAFSAPSCGLIVSDLEQIGQPPNLSHLKYLKKGRPTENIGGLTFRDGEPYASFTLLERKIIQKTGAVIDWLEMTGADKVIGTAEEEMLTATYLDQSWRNDLERKNSECISNDERQTQTTEQPVSCRQLSLQDDDRVTRRQFLGGCDNSWLGGGGDSGGARAGGDPHFRTYDGTTFDFQGAGEYILVQAPTDPQVEVQARFEPISACEGTPVCGSVSVTTALAAKFGDRRVGVYPRRDSVLWIDGTPVENPLQLTEEQISPATISSSSLGDYIIEGPNGLTLDIRVDDEMLDVESTVTDTFRGKAEGLFGYYNGTTEDDFRARNGQIFELPLEHETLYGEFGNDWRVKPSESLFDYADGESTSTYVDRSFPESQASIEDLPEGVLQRAKTACEDIDSQPQKDWCLLDTACTCNSDMGKANEETDPSQSHVNPGIDGPSYTVFGNVCDQQPETLTAESADDNASRCDLPDKVCADFFVEQQHLELSEKLQVDAKTSGSYGESSELEDETISSGTSVHSYLIHLNELPEGTAKLKGRILLNSEILGVIVSGSTLESANGFVGDDSLTYPDSSSSPGLDWSTDSFEISED